MCLTLIDKNKMEYAKYNMYGGCVVPCAMFVNNILIIFDSSACDMVALYGCGYSYRYMIRSKNYVITNL